MAQQKWIIDLTHSEVHFKVKHLMITNVTGSFNNFQVEVTTEEEYFTKSTIHFTAEVDSLSTGNSQRDQHLKSPDFFDISNFPQLKFNATELKKVNGNESYQLTGDLTIKNITKSIVLNVEFGGIAVDPYGNTKAGFSIDGKINRKDFGLAWNAFTEAGGIVVADEVKIICEIQLIKQ